MTAHERPPAAAPATTISGAPSDRGAASGSAWLPRSDLLVLVGLAAVFTVALTYLGQLRFDSFLSGSDLSVNEQLLWTGSHGYLLYETPDRVAFGIHSYLEIHSTFVAFAVAPLYGALPYPATLFALEGAAFAGSVFPLYFLARRSGVSPSHLIPLIVLYLVNFAAFGSLLYDFHWEAFLPAELLSFYLLVRQKSYLLALVPMAFGFLTLEVFPFLVGGVVLLILYERARLLGWRPRAWWADAEMRVQLLFAVAAVGFYLGFQLVEVYAIPALVGNSSVSAGLAGTGAPLVTLTATPTSLMVSIVYWLLLVASFGLFPAFAPRSLLPSLPWFVWSVFLQPSYSQMFGTPYGLVAVAGLAIAYVDGFARWERRAAGSPRTVGYWTTMLIAAVAANVLAFGNSSELLRGQSGWPAGMVVVVLTLALLGIIAAFFLAGTGEPRSRLERAWPRWAEVGTPVLAAVLSDVLLADALFVLSAYSTGNPAIAVAWWTLLVPPLVVGIAGLLGARRVRGNGASNRRPEAPMRRLPFLGSRRLAWAGTVALFVAFNVARSPLNPVNINGAGRGYDVSYAASPSAKEMSWIVGFVPPNAMVLVADNLLPFAANNPNAWPSPPECGSATDPVPCTPDYFPYNASNLPRFVLTDPTGWTEMPYDLQVAVLNASTYGLVAEVYSSQSPPGPVYLFERGFGQSPEERYVTPIGPSYLLTAANLTVGPSGSVVSNPASRFGVAIQSRAAAAVLGNESEMWSGPQLGPVQGLYRVLYNLSGSSPYATSEPSLRVLELNLSSIGGPTPAYLSETVRAGELTGSSWRELVFTVPLVQPYALLETRGFLGYSGGSPDANITVNYVEVTPL